MRSTWKWPVAMVAIVVAVEVFMIVSGMGPDVLLVATAIVAVGGAVWAVVDAAEALPNTAAFGTTARERPTQRVDRRVTRLRSGLAHGQTDALSAERLHDSLVAIVDDQLRAVHRVDRVADPTTAHAIIGPGLASFINDPAARLSLPPTSELDRIITQIERL